MTRPRTVNDNLDATTILPFPASQEKISLRVNHLPPIA
jgi:hypothetical protein